MAVTLPVPTMNATLDVRLAAHGPRLLRQVQYLYSVTGVDDPLYRRLLTILAERHAERSADLRQLDADREAASDWFLDPAMIGYSAYVDKLAGSVAGVADHIDHLQSLGVRYLHLLSLLKARDGDSDGGFAIADYLAVQPALGTMADVEALARRLRAADISLCVDFALNHTSDEHGWALAAKAGDPHYRAFYHWLPDAAAVAAREAELPQVFPRTAPGNFTHIVALDSWAWTTFYPFQWDLNWSNPEVFLAMADMLLALANKGVEVFRLDSIAFLWKRAGTNCRNQPEAHVVVRALRAILDIVAPATLLKAEAIVATQDVLPYFGAEAPGVGFEPECQIVYHNSLMVAGWVALAEGRADLPRAILAESAIIPAHSRWLSYARCHDDIGWGALMGDLAAIDPDPLARLKRAAATLEGRTGSWGRGEAFQTDGDGLHGTNGMLASLAGLEAAGDDAVLREQAFARIRLLHGLAIASGGIATLYMGDEAGLLNDRSYLADPDKAHEGRWLHRPDMDARALQSEAAQRIMADLAELRAARIRACADMVAPAVPLDTESEAVLGLAIGTAVVLLNFSEVTQAVRIRSDLVLHDRSDGCGGVLTRDVPPLGLLWIDAA